MVRANRAMPRAKTIITAPPKAIAVSPARRTLVLFCAPAARPTRIVAAMPMPSGTMKVIDGTLSAI